MIVRTMDHSMNSLRVRLCRLPSSRLAFSLEVGGASETVRRSIPVECKQTSASPCQLQLQSSERSPTQVEDLGSHIAQCKPSNVASGLIE